MHGEHGKFIAYYTQRQPVLCISCAGLHTTCKIKVPSFDTTPYGYMWVLGVCRYSKKYILLLGNFKLSTLSSTVQFNSSNNTSNVYSEGAGLESQLQHQLFFRFFVVSFRLSHVNIKIAPDFKSRLLPSFETPKHHSLQYITYCGRGDLSWYSNSLQAGRSGDRIPVGARFSAPVQNCPGSHRASFTIGTVSLSWGVKGLGCGVDHPPPFSTSVACARVNLAFYNITYYCVVLY